MDTVELGDDSRVSLSPQNGRFSLRQDGTSQLDSTLDSGTTLDGISSGQAGGRAGDRAEPSLSPRLPLLLSALDLKNISSL